ncbi:MAG: hypothetical protein LBP26_04000 [Clostridiales bacterium]|nr:hypothetical protein [Clostridiales bacterium]
MAQKKYTRGANNPDNGVTGIITVISSAFLLLCACIPKFMGVISEFVRAVVVGSFGFVAYPLLVCALIWGIASVRGRKVTAAPKTVAGICSVAFFATMIFQNISSYAYMGEGIGAYIAAVYYAESLTAGGVVFGVLAYGIQSVVSLAFSYVVYSVCILLTGVLAARDKIFIGAPRQKPRGEAGDREFRKTGTPGALVKPLADPGLFVDTIIPKQPPIPVIKTDGGAFGALEPRPGGYNTPYSTVLSGSGGGDVDKKAKAMEILFGSGATVPPVVLPSVVTAGPSIRTAEVSPEPPPPPLKKPRKIVHIDDIPGLKPIPSVPDKDISDPYAGTIINGEQLSRELAERTAPKPASAEPPSATAAEPPRKFLNISEFDTRTAEPRRPEPRPILNGDYYGAAKETESGPRPPFASGSERTADFGPDRRDAPSAFGSEYESETPPFESPSPLNFGSESERDADFKPGFGSEYESDTPDDFEPSASELEFGMDELDGYGGYDDETVEDLSETAFSNGDDTTGYYTVTEPEGRIVTPPPTLLKPENQIKIDDYVRDSVQTDVYERKPKKRKTHYNPPPLDLLISSFRADNPDEDSDGNARARILEDTLSALKLPASVIGITRGPSVTRYELEMPHGIPIKRIMNFVQDIEYNLACKGHIRIETPIPGKRAVGIEVPNEFIDIVALRDVISSREFNNSSSPLTLALGKDIAGSNVICALDKMPHLLIAGATGSGKSACLNSVIISMLYKASPDDLRIILIDPKQVEFTIYRGLPHLLSGQIITDSSAALNAFKWAKKEMERRYLLFSKHVVKNMQEYNKLDIVRGGDVEKLPYIVLIVDELADLMLLSANRKELEDNVMSMAQKARAAGIHLIFATQRPSVDVITGTIKANLPSRIAFAVSSMQDSRTILDQGGAETLLGRGDMLYAPIGADDPRRVQGAFVTDGEVVTIADYVRENNTADFDEEFSAALAVKPESDDDDGGGDDDGDADPLMQDVLKLIIKTNTVSATFLQRRFSIGYARASRIIDQLENLKYIGQSDGGNKARSVLVTRETYFARYGEDVE